MNTQILATFGQGIIAFLFISIALLLVGLVLLQKNRGAGLSGAFGGVGGHSAFGTKTGDFLTWVTVGMTGAFLLLAVVANYAYQPASSAEMMRTGDLTAPTGPTGAAPLKPISGKPIAGTAKPIQPGRGPIAPPSQSPAKSPAQPGAPTPKNPTPSAPPQGKH